MLPLNQTGPRSVLRLPAPDRAVLGAIIALTVALGLAGTGTLLALETALHHQAAAVSQGSNPVAADAPLSISPSAR